MLTSTLQSGLPQPPQPFSGRYSFFSDDRPIIGRSEDIRKLSQWINQSVQQESLMLLVEGEAGVGKTAFVNQLIFDQGACFDFSLYGKFHNAPSKVPYLALRQCVHHWLDQLLMLEDEAFERLKRNVREAVHPHEKVLTSVLGELEILFGKKTFPIEGVKTDPQQERLRFTYYFHKFLKAIHDSGFRTLFFLDDLQWSDIATLHLVHDLFNMYEVPGLVVIGVFRPLTGEKSDSHILRIKELKKVRHFSLKPLGQDELSRLIPSSWELSLEEQKAFREYLMHESAGKPFDALQILSLIVQEKLIEQLPDGRHQIRWNQLPRMKHDESAVMLVMREIQDLSTAASQILQLASCIGFFFSCDRLKNLCPLQADAYRDGLEELVKRKIIITQQDACYFVHDHFYMAAQALLLPGDKEKLHAAIGQYLIDLGALDAEHPDFFDCVNHLNISGSAQTLLTNEIVAILNLSAAKLAQEKSAFDKSLEYYKIAERLLLSSSKQEDGLIRLPDNIPQYAGLPQPLLFKQAYNICKLGIAEGEFLVQNFLLADQALDYILDNVEDRLMRLKGYTIKMKVFVASLNVKDAPFRLKDGMGITEALLKEYHVNLPQNEEEFIVQMQEAYHELLELIPLNNIEELENTPMAEEEEFHDLIHLIVHALPIIFFVDIQKSKYLAVKSMILCLRKGFTPSTPALFASSIWTMATIGKDYELAYRLGQLGLKLVEKAPYKVYRHSVYHLATLNFFNWKHHYRESSAKLDEAVKISLEVGDHNYAIFCFTNARIIDIFRGVSLSGLFEKNKQPGAGMLNINFISKSHIEFVKIMTGEKGGLTEGRFHFSRQFKQQVSESLNGLYHFSFVQESLYLYAGLYPKAMEAGSFCEKHRVLYEAFPIGTEHDFYYCLVLSSLAEERGMMDTDTCRLIEKRLEGLRTLAAMGSGNYQHKQRILEAELARFSPNCMDAVSIYEDAIEEALRQEFIQLAALAAERCGSFLVKMKKQRLAEIYLNDAYHYYHQWGALAKLDQLEEKYPEILFRKEKRSFKPEQDLQDEQETLKWELVQSAISLSQELYVNDLISRVLHISLEQTKAKVVSFLIKQQFSWQLIAKLDEEGMRMMHHNMPVASMVSPHKTLYDCLRLNEICYVPKLTERHELYDVEYFRDKVVHSFMVVPFERHQETLGLIYLENLEPELVEARNLLPWFELLRTQMGIALSNAQLYEKQVKLNQEIKEQEQKRIKAIVETQERERSRVAAELHDHLGQMLSLTKLNLSRLEDSLEGQFALYEETSRLLDESCSELRRIAHDMMPPDFKGQSLQTALDLLFRKYLLAAGLKYNFFQHKLPDEIPVALKLNLYRIAQEIIHNIIKHAAAKKVSIELSVEENILHMVIEDDGNGFDTNFRTDGLGLKSLYSRVNLLNGRLEIDSVIHRGSVFDIYIPLT